MVYVLMASWMAVSVDCAVIQDFFSMPVCVIVTLRFIPRSVHVTCLRDGTLDGWIVILVIVVFFYHTTYVALIVN